MNEVAVPARVDVRCLLTVGDRAEFLAPGHDHSDPVRVPAAVVAEEAGVPVDELPGREFTAVYEAGGLSGFRSR